MNWMLIELAALCSARGLRALQLQSENYHVRDREKGVSWERVLLRVLSATLILSKNSRVLDANLGKNRLISAILS